MQTLLVQIASRICGEGEQPGIGGGIGNALISLTTGFLIPLVGPGETGTEPGGRLLRFRAILEPVSNVNPDLCHAQPHRIPPLSAGDRAEVTGPPCPSLGHAILPGGECPRDPVGHNSPWALPIAPHKIEGQGGSPMSRIPSPPRPIPSDSPKPQAHSPRTCLELGLKRPATRPLCR